MRLGHSPVDDLADLGSRRLSINDFVAFDVAASKRPQVRTLVAVAREVKKYNPYEVIRLKKSMKFVRKMAVKYQTDPSELLAMLEEL